jgi:Domain of unknown function (DUF5615)
MGLSPEWRETFEVNGFEAKHWSEIGNPKAKDREILSWAREHGFIVFTHDLDFGHLLALTHAAGPALSRSDPKMCCPLVSARSSYVPCASTTTCWNQERL